MMDLHESGAYSQAAGRGLMLIMASAIICLVFLLTIVGQSLAVEKVNAGKEGQPLEVNSLSQKGKTTLVDFYSPYCPPCMKLAPMLEKLAQKRPDLVVKKVNIQRPEVSGHIDWQSPLAQQIGLRSIPHFMIFDKKGQVTLQGKEAMQQVLGWLQEAGLLK